jgi:hypothetical protein
MINWQSNNSALACMTQCSKFGFTAAGVEVSGGGGVTYDSNGHNFTISTVWTGML